MAWKDGEHFWWANGNFCRETRYTAIKAVLPDGTEFPIDDF